MKFAIDKLFEKGLINGWVSADNGSEDIVYNVTIRTPEKTVYQDAAIYPRPDVKSAGLHNTGLCGFTFNAKKYGVREGDLIFVELSRDDRSESFTCSFLYAERSETKLEFDRLEIPRDDFSILEKNTRSLFQEYPHLLALKIIMIRLRRYKRGKGGRINFCGVNYDYFNEDWKCFYKIISMYREAIFDNLSIRNIFSITDTIADCSESEERSAALALSFFMFHERFSQTLHPLNKINSFEHLNPSRQHQVWGGMLSNLLENDDALDVYLTRAYEVLGNTPLILSYFEKIILITMNEESSVFKQNLVNSKFFTEVWCIYYDRFKSDLKHSLSNIEYIIN
ncbi:hypothetical protein [Aeromonas rivipollensis]|uniref:hypothetical protein n=1 Tax=Aeromonas rivipollensis TaxID=948519 RepID=UPI0013311D01|nr:hypothetical protein [Aeromonas rivipollensis]